MFYTVRMNTSIEPKAGSWILLVGPRSMNTTMLNAIARLGEVGVSAAHAAETAMFGESSRQTDRQLLDAASARGDLPPEGGAARMPPWPAVRILDGGNRFNAYTVSRAAHGRPDVLNRITVSRAFTCYQVLALLESTPAIPVPFVVLDLLNTFYDESVLVGERKRLLRACIGHLERLSSATRVADTCTALNAVRCKCTADGGWKPPWLVVSAHPPRVPSVASLELLDMLQSSTVDTYFIQTPAPAPEPLRLF